MVHLFDLGLGMRQGGREACGILKIFRKHCHINVNVGRNKKIAKLMAKIRK